MNECDICQDYYAVTEELDGTAVCPNCVTDMKGCCACGTCPTWKRNGCTCSSECECDCYCPESLICLLGRRAFATIDRWAPPGSEARREIELHVDYEYDDDTAICYKCECLPQFSVVSKLDPEVGWMRKSICGLCLVDVKHDCSSWPECHVE